MSREANTQEPADVGPDAATEASTLVAEADMLLAHALPTGSLPSPEKAASFLRQGKLEAVLALYGRAMRLQPNESAHPWNLASALGRLGVDDLATAFMVRAIHIAQESGEAQWSGTDAHLALAELAIDAGESDLALTALARAKALDGAGAHEQQIQALLGEIRAARSDPQPQASLAGLLNRLAA